MSIEQEVREALESVVSPPAGAFSPVLPKARDIAIVKRRIAQFLEQIPGEYSVEEVREALDAPIAWEDEQ